MSDADFKKYFVQAAFEGKDVAPPKEVSSARDVKSVVAARRRHRLCPRQRLFGRRQWNQSRKS